MRLSRGAVLVKPAVFMLASAALLVTQAMAQETGEVLRGPDGGTRTHVAGIDVMPIAGKPFTGKDSIEWTRKLEDGSTVTQHLWANMARDSEGRVYRERRGFIPANSDREPRLTEKIVYDPVVRTKTTCILATHQCTIENLRPIVRFVPQPAGSFAGGTRTLERQDLGTNVIDELNVTGTRETITIAPGVLGNDRPLVSTSEFWYSPDLDNNLAVTREDPREGTQYIHIFDLSRSERDPATFAVPAGYATHDLRLPAQDPN